ncbi:MAG: hypothetical protein JXR70_04350 [Spirochaetales bacterium]|nr:hypothetical protein [Spirochaetales bacterium]
MSEMNESAGDELKMERTRVFSVLLYVLGALLLCRGVLDLLVWMKMLALPLWLKMALDQVRPVESLRALLLWANTGVLAVGLGFWTLVAGFWAQKKMAGYMVFAMAVLSLAVLMGIWPLVRWVVFPSSFDPFFWPDYLQAVIALLGIAATMVMLRTSGTQDKAAD